MGFLPDDVTSSRGSTTATSLLRALTCSRSAPSFGAATRTSICMATILRVSFSLRRWCWRMIYRVTMVGVLLVCRVDARGSHSVFHIVPGHTKKLHKRCHCRFNGLWRERSKWIFSFSAARCRHETGSPVRAFYTASGRRYKVWCFHHISHFRKACSRCGGMIQPFAAHTGFGRRHRRFET